MDWIDISIERHIRAAQSKLTARQREAVELLLDGVHPVPMSKAMGVTFHTVNVYLGETYKRFGISVGCKEVELAALLLLPCGHKWKRCIAVRNGWIKEKLDVTGSK